MAEPIDEKKIQDAVREKCAKMSRSAAGKFNYPTGRTEQFNRAMTLQLFRDMLEELPESFCIWKFLNSHSAHVTQHYRRYRTART
jgi:hypothetical protein